MQISSLTYLEKTFLTYEIHHDNIVYVWKLYSIKHYSLFRPPILITTWLILMLNTLNVEYTWLEN